MHKKKVSPRGITKKRCSDDETLFIKHEFRNELIVVREVISQILDGLCAGNKDCSKYSNILKLALVHVDKISNLIDGLSKICTVKRSGQRVLGGAKW